MSNPGSEPRPTVELPRSAARRPFRTSGPAPGSPYLSASGGDDDRTAVPARSGALPVRGLRTGVADRVRRATEPLASADPRSGTRAVLASLFAAVAVLAGGVLAYLCAVHTAASLQAGGVESLSAASSRGAGAGQRVIAAALPYALAQLIPTLLGIGALWLAFRSRREPRARILGMIATAVALLGPVLVVIVYAVTLSARLHP